MSTPRGIHPMMMMSYWQKQQENQKRRLGQPIVLKMFQNLPKTTFRHRRKQLTRVPSVPTCPTHTKILARSGAIPSGTKELQVPMQPQEEKALTTKTRARWAPYLTQGTSRRPVFKGGREKRRSLFRHLYKSCINNHSLAWLLL